jgi:hypothetical protein
VNSCDPEDRRSRLPPDFAVEWHSGFVGYQTFLADIEANEMFAEMKSALSV